MNFKTFKKLCTPARLYFVVSTVLLLLIILGNLTNDNNTLCLGNYSCNVSDKLLVILLNAVYIVFYTYVLNLICKDGWSSLSWFLVLLPFVMLLLLIILGTTTSAFGGMPLNQPAGAVQAKVDEEVASVHSYVPMTMPEGPGSLISA